MALCAECFIGCIENLVEYFNRYAYIEIGMSTASGRVVCDHLLISLAALYGKPYIQAAKDTWNLFKDRGIDALVNDSLVGMSESDRRPLPLRVLTPSSSLDVGSLRGWSVVLTVCVSIPSLYPPGIQRRWAVHCACRTFRFPYWFTMLCVTLPPSSYTR